MDAPQTKPRTLLLCGGGTGGSVAPLLAVAEIIQQRFPDVRFSFVGTRRGPEGEWVRRVGIPFTTIPAGKLPRYPTWQLFPDLWNILAGFIAGWRLLRHVRPDVVMSAGGYVAVPVVWAAWLMGIPCHIHQQDVRPGLANRLMQPFAKQISVVFRQSLKHFPVNRTHHTGNPVRLSIQRGNPARARRLFDIFTDRPLILCLGGGTGALSLNELVVGAALELIEEVDVVHITGRGKNLMRLANPHYHPLEFVYDELADLYAAATLIVSRAGLSTLTEIAFYGKAAILVPLPGTHQQENALLYRDKGAAVLLPQTALTPHRLAQAITELIDNPAKRLQLERAVKQFAARDASDALASLVVSLLPSRAV